MPGQVQWHGLVLMLIGTLHMVNLILDGIVFRSRCCATADPIILMQAKLDAAGVPDAARGHLGADHICSSGHDSAPQELLQQ